MAGKKRNWLHVAGATWPVLVGAAQNGTLLRYKELGEVLGIHHRSVRWALGPIQDYCEETKRPPLSVLVVGSNLRPGSGFIAWDLDDIDAALEAVRTYNWSAVSNPFGHIAVSDSEADMIRQLIKHPETSEAVYKMVPDRGVGQRIFRKALLLAYANQCAFCKCSFESALEAAHIIPWRDATHAQRLDVRNGILLCATHHRMFDRSDISLTANHTISYCDPSAIRGVYTSADTALGPALHGQPLHLPPDKDLRPAAHLIEKRLAYLERIKQVET